MNKKTVLLVTAVLALTVVGLVLYLRPVPSQTQMPAPTPGAQTPQTMQTVPITVVPHDSAPEEVRAAAKILRDSKVGVAFRGPTQTYLMISTGRNDFRVSVDRAEGQPPTGTPDFVDVFLKSAPGGDRQLIATVPLTTAAFYQFQVDDGAAFIPTLVNRDNLPLIHLDDTQIFALISPQPDQVISGDTIRLTGFGRPFEATFGVTVLNAKGRPIGGLAPVMAAAGGPNWGSFAVDVPFDRSLAGDTGFIVLEEGGLPSRHVFPIRFAKPPQMG